MKTKSILKGLMVLAACMMTTLTHAQKIDENTGLVVWEGSSLQEALNISSQGGYFFLVEFKETLSETNKERYVSASGNYGVQAVLTSVGMRMQLVVSQDNGRIFRDQFPTAYQFVSRIMNADSNSGYLGDRMGFDGDDSGKSIYLDRSDHRAYWNGNQNNPNNFPNWVLNESTSTKRGIRYKGETGNKTVNITTYTIQNTETRQNGNYRASYITLDANGRLVTTYNENQATKWVIVSETDFDEAMQQVTWGEVDLGVFVQDANFGRDNKDGIYWVWENAEIDPRTGMTLDDRQLTGNNIHWHQRNQDVMCNGIDLSSNNIARDQVGRNVASNNSYTHDAFRQSFGEYYSAEIYNEVNSLTQTLHGATIPNLVDGLYKLTAQALYYDDANGTTNNSVAYFVVKREVLDDDGNVIETTTEYMPVVAMNTVSNNITAHSGVSAGYEFNNNPDKYLLTTFVEISGKVNLTIGIQQRTATGWTVIGNVHLYAHGKQALYVDEDWTDNVTLTYKKGDNTVTETGNPYTLARWHDNYDYPSTVYYQRTFTVNAWNTICLPLSLTGRQVRNAFGDDAQVCVFEGQSQTRPSLIYFARDPEKDLDVAANMDKYVIEAGIPYLIYVSREPQHTSAFEAEVGNGKENHTMQIDGAAYSIPGVIKSQYAYTDEISSGVHVLKDPVEVEGNGGFKMVGSFYHTVIDKANIHGSSNPNGGINDMWVITKGDMYHLTGNKDWNVWATYAYIYLPKSASGNAKEFSFAINDGHGIQEIATYIDGLFVEKEGNSIEDHEVYNLSGIKVGKGTLDTLPKGIYILDGKKYIKK